MRQAALCAPVAAVLGFAGLVPAPADAGTWLSGDEAAVSQGCRSYDAARFLADAWETDAIAVSIAHRMLARSGDCPVLAQAHTVTLVEPLRGLVDYTGRRGTIWRTDMLGIEVFVLIPDDSGPHEAI